MRAAAPQSRAPRLGCSCRSSKASGHKTRPTFRTSTALATVDAVVVDAEGQPVINLTAADFDIEQGGKQQVLRQAVYVPLGASARP